MTELPVIPITIGDMDFNRTGLWRYLMPVVRTRSAPCQAACPLGMPSPDFINELLKKNPAAALSRIMECNPLPGITGQLCYHPCQSKCLRRGLDGAVQIQKLEQYLAGANLELLLPEPEKVEGNVAVIGAGPLGLSAAYFLGRAGLAVTVLDPMDRAGGFLAALDEDRLPQKVLDLEIERLTASSLVRLKTGREYESAASGGPERTWSLIIHDRTAHPLETEPGKSLAGLAEQWSSNCSTLGTEGVCPSGKFKASQIAVAVTAGRSLAEEALGILGLNRQLLELRGISDPGRSEEVIGENDIRYEVFDRQGPVSADPESGTFSRTQALEEAGRCLSCGHCNLCGQCLVFCPDVSLRVDEQAGKLQIDEMHCKGCGICAHECPRGALVMEN